MSSFSEQEKSTLLQLAREAIASTLEHRHAAIRADTLPQRLRAKQSCFVTLTLNGTLRGCIGHLLPIQPLWQDVAENAHAAAFDDPRFHPLTSEEFADLKIEISVLALPQPLQFSSTKKLCDILRKRKPGVIIKKGRNRATFLPQVWDEVPIAEEFLSHLCAKAGLSVDEWQRGVDVEVYNVEKITG
jgi:AmmeMemoRadiSam system protein A